MTYEASTAQAFSVPPFALPCVPASSMNSKVLHVFELCAACGPIAHGSLVNNLIGNKIAYRYLEQVQWS